MSHLTRRGVAAVGPPRSVRTGKRILTARVFLSVGERAWRLELQGIDDVLTLDA